MHDNPVHHAVQARLVDALEPRAIVFEMVEQADALKITTQHRENSVALETLLRWDDLGWPDFAMYFPIFQAAGDAPVYGAALPRAKVREAVSIGAASVFGDGAALFGLTDTLPASEQAAREALQQAAHCNAMPTELLPGMVEAQRLRDAALARAVVTARAEPGRGPVVVIAGNGHARHDWGVPQALSAYMHASDDQFEVVSLAQYEESAPDQPPVTHWIVTASVAREDPCAAFQ